jgi:transcriptional regulatory protein LEU3
VLHSGEYFHDRSWAVTHFWPDRMAIELGLNQPFPPGCDERECLNRTRTWLICFCVDGSYATQFGKMAMIPLNDHLARNSRHWYQSSALTSPFDIHLCAIVDIHLVFADFRKAVSQGNLRKNVGEVGCVVIYYVRSLLTSRRRVSTSYPLLFNTMRSCPNA